MNTKKRNLAAYRIPTEEIRTGVDFCDNGCVNLHFGATVIHLPERDFLIFQKALGQVAEELVSKRALFPWMGRSHGIDYQ